MKMKVCLLRQALARSLSFYALPPSNSADDSGEFTCLMAAARSGVLASLSGAECGRYCAWL